MPRIRPLSATRVKVHLPDQMESSFLRNFLSRRQAASQAHWFGLPRSGTTQRPPDCMSWAAQRRKKSLAVIYTHLMLWMRFAAGGPVALERYAAITGKSLLRLAIISIKLFYGSPI
jgi:hypothetical protein